MSSSLRPPWTIAHQASLSFTISLSLLKLISIDLVMPSNHLILFCPLLPLSSIFPNIRDFSNGLILNIRWPNYWEFSFSISPFNEESELITFRIDCSDLLAVQGTFKNPLQHHSSKASISCAQPSLWSNSYICTWLLTRKTTVLSQWTFVSRVMSLLVNTLSRFVIPFLPRSKHLLISWLQSPSAVLLEPRKLKSVKMAS